MAGFNVYVYPNTATTDVQEPTEGLRQTLDDIVTNSNVPDYNVEIIDEHPNIEASSIYQMLDPWRRWLQQNGYQGPGSHLLAAEGSGGIAEGAGEAWARPMACVSMLEDFVFSQEVLHNFIDSSLPEVRELGYAQDYEHSLGKVFQGGDVSPMTAGYVQDGHAAAGQCGREEQTQRNVLTPTECTTLANQYSWEEHDGGGGDPPEPGQPTASFDFSPTDPSVDETVTFDASGSSPPEGGRIASYEWDFGDGATATGETVAHRFGSAGEFDVRLTVTADNGETDTATQRVPVSDDGGGRCGAETTTASAQGYLSGGWWGSGSDNYTYTLDTASPCSATVTLDGPSSADFDLYLTLDGRTPTTRDYDEASYSSNSQEEITVDLSGDEELGLLVDSYSGSGYYTIAVEELGE